jgi:hypothetical protein
MCLTLNLLTQASIIIPSSKLMAKIRILYQAYMLKPQQHTTRYIHSGHKQLTVSRVDSSATVVYTVLR